jgi:hypothetical protein
MKNTDKKKFLHFIIFHIFNPLPHGVLATFSLTAGGPIGPPKKDDISREKTILMTSLRILLASAVRREGLPYTYQPPLPPSIMKRSLGTFHNHYLALISNTYIID